MTVPPEPPPKAPPEESLHVLVAQVPAGSLGPRLIRSSEGNVVVWAVPSGPQRGLFSALVSDGKLQSSPSKMAGVDTTARQLGLGRTGAGEVLATTVHKRGEQEILRVVRLDAHGQARGKPFVVSTTPAEILFHRIVPTSAGALAIWVETAGNQADLYSVVIDEKGPRRAQRVVHGIRAWQVAHRGRAISVVTREGDDLVLRQLDDLGKVIGAPIGLAQNVSGGADVDVAIGAYDILVAYSARESGVSQLFGTLLDASGNVLRTPTPLTRGRGEQALLAVLADVDGLGFQVAWHEPRMAYHEQPSIFVGAMSRDDPLVESRVRVRSEQRDPLLPIFATTEAGLVALTDVDCGLLERKCGASLARARALVPRQGKPVAEPVRVPGGQLATMAWDLTCREQNCDYLLAGRGAPTPVYLARTSARGGLDGVVDRVSEAAPLIESFGTIGPLPELSELAGVELTHRKPHLVSWLSYFDPDEPYVVPSQPAPDGRRAPVRARLSTLSIDPEAPTPEQSVISYRARSLGGVSLVAPQDGRGLLSWAALDGNEPQLFATVVDESGRRLRQRMLTRTKGEVTDVAAVRVEGGYLLGWIDAVGATPEVFALYVSENLVPQGKPRKVSSGALSPSGVALGVLSGRVLCVWSDARGTTSSGVSDIYGTFLDPQTAQPLSAERSLLSSGGHDFAPQLVQLEAGQLALAHLSRSSKEGKPARTSLEFARVLGDGSATYLGRFTGDGQVSDFSFQCEAGSCKAVAVLSSPRQGGGARVSLWGLGDALDEGDEGPEATSLLPLWTTSPEGVSPLLLGSTLYFADRKGRSAEWALHRARVVWPGD